MDDTKTTVVYSEQPSSHLRLAIDSDAQSTTSLKYLAEGNANIVYAFKPSVDNANGPGPRRKLLRLRKEKSFIQPTQTQFALHQREFAPLFPPENLVEQSLITLDEALIRSLNRELEERENVDARKQLRHGDRLANDDYGLLITDMTARHGEYLFEIKPKWLQQSPDAPEGSIRCRTCALRLQRNSTKAQGAAVPTPGNFCPLSLIDEDFEERRNAFKSIIEAQAHGLESESVEIVVTFLARKGYRVLLDLREHQARFDRDGLLMSFKDVSENYSKAMTLRDCVLFVKGSLDSFENTAEIRLADLDFKHAHPEKLRKWVGTERALIDQGWYTSTEVDEGSMRACLLTRRYLSPI